MAQKKKASTKKVTAKKVTATATPTPKPKKPAAPTKPTYDDVHAARQAMDAADEQVTVAGRNLNRAKSDFADFDRRDKLVREAGDNLVEARKAAAVATDNFKKVKKAAQ